MIEITCNVCEAKFPQVIDEVPTEDGGLSLSFKCPECDTLYPVARLSARALEIRAQIRETTDKAEVARLRLELKGEVSDERIRREPGVVVLPQEGVPD
jgi:hypothetical protein